ncbi:MAG TPA: NEW3 domain-containing protein [Bacteroidales bacterium]|nr:NEW3 domain-containing protein [Bacteroidales bacterium]
MSTRTRCILVLALFIGALSSQNSSIAAPADSITLYTPYTKISVPPGESIDYTIDVINNSHKKQNVDILIAGLPKGWNYTLKSGGWTVSQISVLPGERKDLNLAMVVPQQVNKGTYYFSVQAKGFTSMPLAVNVSQQGTFKTEFTTGQANMQGLANANFTFSAKLKNQTAEKQLYALMADLPAGWAVTFKSSYNQVTSVEVEANNTADLTIEVNPPDNIDAGTYEIPVRAVTKATSANLSLQVVITGTYSMELTTPSGLLSTDLTAGESKKVELLVRNTGSSDLSNIKLSASSPTNWNITFEPQQIDKLLAKSDTKVIATIKAYKNAIPGDYASSFNAQTLEANVQTQFRFTVKTAMLWGWIGVLIIVAAAGGVYYMFRKYGRR